MSLSALYVCLNCGLYDFLLLLFNCFFFPIQLLFLYTNVSVLIVENSMFFSLGTILTWKYLPIVLCNILNFIKFWEFNGKNRKKKILIRLYFVKFCKLSDGSLRVFKIKKNNSGQYFAPSEFLDSLLYMG